MHAHVSDPFENIGQPGKRLMNKGAHDATAQQGPISALTLSLIIGAAQSYGCVSCDLDYHWPVLREAKALKHVLAKTLKPVSIPCQMTSAMVSRTRDLGMAVYCDFKP